MYQNIWVDRKPAMGLGTGKPIEVHIWDDKVGHNVIQYKDYAYKKNSAGTYFSLYGDKLIKTNKWNRDEYDADNVLYADLIFETKVLVELYSESDDVSVNHRELIFDIEVEVTDGFPQWKTAENKITSIALYDKVADSYCCLILGNIKNSSYDNVIIESFESEEELLQRFCQKYLEINPTILTGWNTEFFDIPYLYNRLTRVLGEQFANTLSPIGRVVYDEYRGKYKIAGVSQLDYLSLYKLYTYSQEPSYRLDAIGQKEVGIGKVEYEGTLNDLYRDDIEKFIDYNLNDVIIVAELDKKLKFIDLARAVAHKGHIPYEDVYMSSRYLEGAMMVYMKKLGIVPPLKPKGGYENKEKPFSGAFVKDPIPGRYEWVYDLDLTSMYPSTIMTLNTSPETKLGKIDNWNPNKFVNSTQDEYSFIKNNKMKQKLPNKFKHSELKHLFESYPISISANGVIYKNNKQGLIPSILSKWFDERVEYKKLMKQFGNEGNTEKYEYFKKRQLVQKILLNSMYGVLGSPTFRFYDVDNAEATTLTGQMLIKYTQKTCNEYYNNELKDDSDHVIYTDTDSIFVSSVPIIKKRFPNANIEDDSFMTDKILIVAKEVQDHLNQKYNEFAKLYLNCDKHRFDIKQEVIAKSAFWVAKKRYGQWIINENGVTCDKLDVKGLDIIRSSFPPAFRKVMTEVLQGILNNQKKDLIDDIILVFKKEMKEMNILEIALNTSVKGLQKYVTPTRSEFSQFKKAAPVHVKAAVRYNDLIKKFNLENKVELIKNQDKIKWVYLKANPYNLQSIALKGYDDPKEILDLANEFIDHGKLFESQLNKKIKMFYNALNWTEPVNKKNSIERFF